MADSVKVMLAGPGHDVVFYHMQPSFLEDKRFTISAHATQWALFEPGLSQMQPDLVIVQAELAPGPDALLPLLARMQAWNGVALVILPPELKDLLGVYKAAASVVRGVFISPVNWVEIAQAGFSAVMTERARLTSTAPLQQALTQASSRGHAPGVTGTRRIAVLSHAGGAGCSTIAENLAYELSVHLKVNTLLVSLGLPPAVVPHFDLHYEPSLQEYFDRPSRAVLQSAMQQREGMQVLVAPESSPVYLRADERARKDPRDPAGLYSLLLNCEDGNYAAVIMDTPAHEDTWTALPLVYANTVLVVARSNTADCAAVGHTLKLLLYGLSEENRKPKESIHLVLNQFSDRSGMTPRSFQEQLAGFAGWAPPVAAVVPYDPAVQEAQEQGIPAINRADSFTRGIRALTQTLFPKVSHPAEEDNTRSVFRIPRIRIGGRA